MARKWFKFHFVVESFLNKAQLILHNFTLINRWYYRLIILVFLGVFITVGIHPVLSQIPTFNPIKQELTDITKLTKDKNICYIPDEVGEVNDANKLMEIGKNCYEIGNFVYAVRWLEKAVTIFQSQKDQQINLAITYANLSLAYQQLSEANLSELPNFKKSHQQLSNLQFAELNIAESFKILTQKNIDEKKKQQVLGQVWNIKGKLQFAQGKVEKALKSWEEAVAIYDSIGNQYGKLSSQINQVQALQALGLFEPAKTKVKEIKKQIETIQDNPKYNNLKSKVLRSLGDVLRAVGELEESEEILDKLKKSLDNSQTPEDKENKNAALLSLGNTLLAQANLARDREATANYEYMPWRCEKNNIPEKFQEKYQKAIEKYQEAIEEDDNVGKSQGQSITEIKAKLNRLRILIDLGNWETAQTVRKEINTNKLVDKLPNSRDKVYARINFAKSLACLQQKTSDSKIKYQEIIGELTTAIKDAKNLSIQKAPKKDEDLKDNRAISYATGNLGGLYEYFAWVNQQQQQNTQGKEAKKWQQQAEDWHNKAKNMTEEALYLAQPAQMPDIAYQWQWQLGRLFEAEGDNKRGEAIAFYQSARETLKSVRSDLLAINTDVQFNFRDNIEPLYRGLVNLLFEEADNPKELDESRKVIQDLQLSELENFLKCSLSKDIQSTDIDKIVDRENSEEAVIYPIIFKNKIDIVLKLPKTKLKYYHPCDDPSLHCENINKVLQQLQLNLPEDSKTGKVKDDAQQLYKWLIEPLKNDLDASGVKTLVFLLDARLRNIPMAVLYDGKQYLIDNYAVAVTSGLELKYSKPSERNNLKALLAGLTKSYQKLSPLKDVAKQFDKIGSEIPSERMLDEKFNKEAFKNKINQSYIPIVHLATHGEFSSDPDKTFILTSNGKIKAKELSNLLQSRLETNPKLLELLVLAACQTAKGDTRASLGLAGIAVKTGAKSTLATLWKIIADDSPGDLMSHFYRELKRDNSISKAEALRRAQREFIKDNNRKNPYYWAAYILIGNWL